MFFIQNNHREYNPVINTVQKCAKLSFLCLDFLLSSGKYHKFCFHGIFVLKHAALFRAHCELVRYGSAKL